MVNGWWFALVHSVGNYNGWWFVLVHSVSNYIVNGWRFVLVHSVENHMFNDPLMVNKQCSYTLGGFIWLMVNEPLMVNDPYC